MLFQKVAKYCGSVIAQRGLDYYLSGKVVEIDQWESVWSAKIKGPRPYNVRITLKVAKMF